MTEHEPELYDTVNGRRVMTDGGVAAAGGPALGPGGTDPAGALTSNGDGFDQFVALATAATTAESHPLHANAAQQAGEFRANSRLRKDEWITLDENLVEVAQEQLVLVDDLRNRGLTVDEDLATLIREHESTDEFGAADVDMSGESGASEDASTFTLNGTPLPIVHKSFHIKRRNLLASRRRGQGLDVTNQAKAARVVMEGLEDLVINGWTGVVQNYNVHGLRTHPNRNQVVGSADWTAAATTGDQIRNDVLSVVEALENDNYGPEGPGYVFAIARPEFQAMRRKDTGTDNERSVLERLRDEFGDMIDFVRADRMPGGELTAYKPVEDVIQLANASDVQNVEWESGSGWTMHMKVMASMTPIIKSDDAGQSGVAHMTGI